MSLAYAEAEDTPRWEYPSVTAGISYFQADPVVVPVARVSPPITTRSAAWLEPIRAQFSELLALPANWDGRGSAAIKQDTLMFAVMFLFQTLPANAQVPGIIPLGNGGIQLIWHGRRGELEIEIVGPFQVEVFFQDENGTESAWRVSNDFASIGDLLRERFTS